MNGQSAVALRMGAIALVALLMLQIFWHAWLEPPPAQHFWPTLALAVAPLLPGLWTIPRNLRRGVLIGAIVCLFYFCHAIAVLHDGGGARWPAAIELALTLGAIGASGWDARKFKRTPRH